MANFYHKFDLPASVSLKGDLAIDTEAMGLNNHRDRLCVVQLADGNGDAHLVHFPTPNYEAPNLRKLLNDNSSQKIFHFARFDIAIIKCYLEIEITNIFCTKIASRLCRTYTDSHGLRDLCAEILDVKLSKQQQTSNWGHETLTQEQIAYAAADVLYLHKLRAGLTAMLEKEGRLALANDCFKFLPHRASLDLMGWNEFDIFQH
jgi:ribonuclease D